MRNEETFYLSRMRVAVVLLLIFAVFVTLVAGCSIPFFRQEGRLQQEPTISVFFDEENTQRNLKLEEYLLGVVAQEMDPSWPMEALKAQAILARTFTMKKLEEGGVKDIHGTDACTNPEHFQAYNAQRINDRVREAVASTRGMVMLHDGQFIRGWFFADSGGKTATAQEGLNFKGEPTPYVKVVNDVAGPDGFEQWTATFTKEEVATAAKQVANQDPGDFDALEVTDKGPSGRATMMRIGSVTVNAADFRVALDSKKMKSTLFTKEPEVSGDKVTFSGKGFGHGVGMAQQGARAQAEEGKKAEDILRFYYKDIRISQRWK